ncbi:terminase small subunit [Candidimonas humi]|uniref:Terminase small subunit n=1 Tax=Candidimonas humi TaxID=683355 RepID=A0ABV8NXL8_9BURK|nr:terminase small subunit [Candidimonas humi]MBV6304926.1 terminase small subunit [Candidimonas humi]
MALTDKKRRFVVALQSGLAGAKAAVKAGYSEKGAAQAASRLMKDADVKAALERKKAVNKAKAEAKASGREFNLPDLGKMFSDPKEFLKAVMNDPSEEMKLRVEAAKTLMPFDHGKVADQGKKGAKADAAKKAATGRFAPKAPPRLVVNNK